MAPSIMWFRRDLRLDDHPALHEAVRLGGADGVVPVFILDEALLAPCGPARASFLAECLRSLELEMGSPLVVRAGDPAIELCRLVREVGATDVVVSADFGPVGSARDRAVEAALRTQGVELHRSSSPYAVDPGTVVGERGAPLKVFGAFRRRWELVGPSVILGPPDATFLQVSSTAAIDDIVATAGVRRPALFGDLPDRATAPSPPASPAAARGLLETFVAGPMEGYASDRDRFALAATSHLSPHLRFGTLHPRTALAAARGAGDGPATFRAELCWREFYADVLHHNPSSVRQPLQAQFEHMAWDSGPDAEASFRTWARGMTGIPLVDAAMRQLDHEGWLHNRARMVAASFLVKHLHLDWRWGARWFMWRLVDGDLASNTHGWQWTAGCGTDAAPFFRIFSPVAQAERFDPQGAYIHEYVPELAGISAPRVFAPGGGVDLLSPADYPAPMIDLATERAEALRRLAATKDAATQR
jgi:deoxyribodipyrimidine photo-lyase